MSKHTPGPWIRSYHGFNILTADEEQSICQLTNSRYVSRDERTANARLIAAAPAMYEALKGLTDWFYGIGLDDDHSQEDGGLPPELAKAEEALAMVEEVDRNG